MTLGLSQITNDADATIKLLERYGKYFDKLFITVADKNKEVFYALQKLEEPKLELSYYKWADDFSKARNHNLKTIDTDYWFWMDSDDQIENVERLPDLLQYMAKNDVDVMMLRYDYSQNMSGEAISDHWRERLVRTSYGGHWDAPVHETYQGPPAVVERSNLVVVKHHKTLEDQMKSSERNKRILTKHFNETKDPRDASYLGNMAIADKEYEQAIQLFMQHINTSGSPEDIYRSWCRIADCEWILKNYEQALYATDEAIKIRPAFPDAYYIKVLIYTNTEAYENGIEWLKVALSKPIPDTLHMIDPTLYKYRGMAMGAMCYLFSGRVKEAFKMYQAVLAENPEFYKEWEKEDGVDWPSMYETAYYDQKAIDYTRYLAYYVGTNGGKPITLLSSLPPHIFADTRLNAERQKFLPKTVWPKGSVAYYCGHGSETWGADTLDKGMGGSEEAVVYLSRELNKLGNAVTVYNDREEEYTDLNSEKIDLPNVMGETVTKVIYKPWTLLNTQDKFDTFVAWRMPELLRGIKARVKICDLHDTIQPERVYQAAKLDPEAKFFVKSKYHRDLYPDLSDDHFVIIGNGIVKEHFV